MKPKLNQPAKDLLRKAIQEIHHDGDYYLGMEILCDLAGVPHVKIKSLYADLMSYAKAVEGRQGKFKVKMVVAHQPPFLKP